MKLSNSDLVEVQKYIEVLNSLPIAKVESRKLVEGDFSPFINNIATFQYQTENLHAYDMFPVLICFGFTLDKRNKKTYIKGINLNYVPIEVRLAMTKLLLEIKDRLKVMQSEKKLNELGMLEHQMNAYDVFKAEFKEYVGLCYKKYLVDSVVGLRMIPKDYWNMMVRFPLDTFVEISKKKKKGE